MNSYLARALFALALAAFLWVQARGVRALFIGAIVALLSSLRQGEAAVERDQIAAAAREYRARRERDRR